MLLRTLSIAWQAGRDDGWPWPGFQRTGRAQAWSRSAWLGSSASPRQAAAPTQPTRSGRACRFAVVGPGEAGMAQYLPEWPLTGGTVSSQPPVAATTPRPTFAARRNRLRPRRRSRRDRNCLRRRYNRSLRHRRNPSLRSIAGGTPHRRRPVSHPNLASRPMGPCPSGPHGPCRPLPRPDPFGNHGKDCRAIRPANPAWI